MNLLEVNDILLNEYNLKTGIWEFIHDEFNSDDGSYFVSVKTSLINCLNESKYTFIGKYAYYSRENEFYVSCEPDEMFRIQFVGKSEKILSLLNRAVLIWVREIRVNEMVEFLSKMRYN